MSQILLLEKDVENREIIKQLLETFIKVNVIDVSETHDALSYLNLFPDIKMIITTSEYEGETIAITINQFLDQHQLMIPVVAMGVFPNERNLTSVLPQPVVWEQMLRLCVQQLSMPIKDRSERGSKAKMPISIKYFYGIERAPCDIYLGLHKQDASVRLVKRFKAFDPLIDSEIKKYEEQGVSELFIDEEFRFSFVVVVSNQLMLSMEQRSSPLTDQITNSAKAFEVVKTLIACEKFESVWNDLTHHSVSTILGSIRTSPTTARIMKLLSDEKIELDYLHTYLVILIAHYALSGQKLYRDSQLDVLAYVSFIKGIKKGEELEAQLELLKRIEDRDEAIELILKQSNGTVDGVGYAHDPGEELHALSKVYLVANSFVSKLLEPGQPKDKKEIISLLNEQYSNFTYKRILKSLTQKYQ